MYYFDIIQFILIYKGNIQFMEKEQQPNPLHGMTLEKILNKLLEDYGWEELGRRINIKCFNSDPSVKSSLKFIRKNEWARKKVERLFLERSD